MGENQQMHMDSRGGKRGEEIEIAVRKACGNKKQKQPGWP